MATIFLQGRINGFGEPLSETAGSRGLFLLSRAFVSTPFNRQAADLLTPSRPEAGREVCAVVNSTLFSGYRSLSVGSKKVGGFVQQNRANTGQHTKYITSANYNKKIIEIFKSLHAEKPALKKNQTKLTQKAEREQEKIFLPIFPLQRLRKNKPLRQQGQQC